MGCTNVLETDTGTRNGSVLRLLRVTRTSFVTVMTNPRSYALTISLFY